MRPLAGAVALTIVAVALASGATVPEAPEVEPEDSASSAPPSPGGSALPSSPSLAILRDPTPEEALLGWRFVFVSTSLTAGFSAGGVQVVVAGTPLGDPLLLDRMLPPRSLVAGSARAAARSVLEVSFPGSQAVEPVAGAASTVRVNVLVGAEATWGPGLHSYERLTYHGLQPGIDLVFRADPSGLKYEFVVGVGARWQALEILYRGAEWVEVTPAGGLLIDVRGARLADTPPVSFTAEGETVDCRFASRGALRVGFECAGAPHGTPFTIDPLLAATLVGSPAADKVTSLDLTANGSVVVAGQVESGAFPNTTGAYDRTYAGSSDCFIAEFSADLKTLHFATFLGGSNLESCQGLRVRGDGAIVVTGITGSSNFPTTAGAYDETANGGLDAFVSVLSGDGSSLLASTLVGSSDDDEPSWVELAPDGDPVVVGVTTAADFPATPGSFDPAWTPSAFDTVEDFALRLTRDLDGLVFCTFFGGTQIEFTGSVALDASENVHVVGSTYSDDFPTTPSAYDRTFAAPNEGFLIKLNASGDRVLFSTLLGGNLGDTLAVVQVAANGEPVVGGTTSSTDFPTTAGAFNRTHGGGFDAFVARLSTDGQTLRRSTFLGASGDDYLGALALDASDNVVVAGDTESPSFPTVPGSGNLTGPTTAYRGYLLKLNASGDQLLFGTFFGGNVDDITFEVRLSSNGTAFLVGTSFSTDFATTSGAFQAGFQGGTRDGFVASFTTTPGPVSMTVRANRPGVSVLVQGSAVIAPYTFSCAYRAPVTVLVPPQPPSPWQRLTFANWSDGGARNHTALCGVPPTLEVHFTAEFLLTVDTSPPGLYVGLDGAVGQAPQTLWAAEGSVHSVDATVTQIVAGGRGAKFAFWSDAQGAVHNVTANRSLNLTATFVPTVQVTVDSVPSGLPVSVDGASRTTPAFLEWAEGEEHAVEVNNTLTDGRTRHTFYRWSDGGARSHLVNYSTPASLTAYFATEVLIELGTSPPGLNFTVDTQTYRSPQSFWWAPGDRHTLSAPAVQERNGTRHTYAGWLPGGAGNLALLVGQPAAFNATFDVAYEVTLRSPSGAVTVNFDGEFVSTPVTRFVPAGSLHTLTGGPVDVQGTTRYRFTGWVGGATYNQTAVNGPLDLVANVTTEYLVALETHPPGLEIILDADPLVAPVDFWWPAGEWHVISATEAFSSEGTRYAFLGWSDGREPSHVYTVTGAAVVVARYSVEHRVTIRIAPSGAEVRVDGAKFHNTTTLWLANGSTHAIVVPAGQRILEGHEARFDGWSDGGAQNRTLIVDGPVDLTASFSTVGSGPPVADYRWLMVPIVALALAGLGILALFVLRRGRP